MVSHVYLEEISFISARCLIAGELSVSIWNCSVDHMNAKSCSYDELNLHKVLKRAFLNRQLQPIIFNKFWSLLLSLLLLLGASIIIPSVADGVKTRLDSSIEL